LSRDYTERVETRAEDGTLLSAGVVRPDGEPRAIILAGHALMTNARSLDRPMGKGLASYLARRGYLVVAADFRGHGRSGVRASKGGDWSYDDLVFQDLPALLALAGGLEPGKKLVVIGQSLMAHVCAAYLGQKPDAPVDALVAVSSNMWLRSHEDDWLLRAKKDVRILSVKAFTAGFGYFPARLLRIGSEDESAGFTRQMVSCYFDSFWGTQDGRIDYLAGLANIKTKILVVRGKGDKLSCTSQSIRRFHARVPDVTYREVGKGDQDLDFDPEHMSIITDNRSSPVWAGIADWLGEQVAG
jgi:predicted alpha/beta hydrolase